MFTKDLNSGHKNLSADDISLAELKQMTARFIPIPLIVPTDTLSEADEQALIKLIQAAQILNNLFMEQLWKDNIATFSRLQQDKSELGRARLHYYWLNKGPWSEADQDKPFIPGVEARPDAANFYPEGISKEELEIWLKTLDENQQAEAKGFFTILTRDKANEKNPFCIVAYSEFYKTYLMEVASLLREAAQLTTNPSLTKYLNLRADAFLSNDYYESDIAWMELDAPLDITIGPYETYEDKLLGYKASFEAFINLRDDVETKKLAFFSTYLQEIENNLPIPPQYRNPKIGTSSPIRVVNELFATGHAARSVQTAAFNLPNDERVLSETGGKRVLLKNVQEAKFKHILVPIAYEVLSVAELPSLNFDAFFTHILAHELSHGLGPQVISVNGRETSPRSELKELYSAIEEAKADVMGIFMLQYLLDQQSHGNIQLQAININEHELYVTYFVEMFRTMRFGINESHGKGMALQFNYLQDKGAIKLDKQGKFQLVWDKIKPAFLDLTHDLLMIEATGDYFGAKQLLETKAIMTPELQVALAKMTAIPIDFEPVFVTAKQLVNEVIESGEEFENAIDVIKEELTPKELKIQWKAARRFPLDIYASFFSGVTHKQAINNIRNDERYKTIQQEKSFKKLFKAIKEGDFDQVKKCFEKYKIDPNRTCCDEEEGVQKTILSFIIERDDNQAEVRLTQCYQKITQYLLEKGADITKRPYDIMTGDEYLSPLEMQQKQENYEEKEKNLNKGWFSTFSSMINLATPYSYGNNIFPIIKNYAEMNNIQPPSEKPSVTW